MCGAPHGSLSSRPKVAVLDLDDCSRAGTERSWHETVQAAYLGEPVVTNASRFRTYTSPSAVARPPGVISPCRGWRHALLDARRRRRRRCEQSWVSSRAAVEFQVLGDEVAGWPRTGSFDRICYVPKTVTSFLMIGSRISTRESGPVRTTTRFRSFPKLKQRGAASRHPLGGQQQMLSIARAL